MSVRIGMPSFALIDASTRSPSARPGPRNDRPDVRLALSNDALKTNGTFTRRAISEIAAAIACACASLSMTHGPAINVNGLSPFPSRMSPIWTAFMRVNYGAGRAGQAGRAGRGGYG